MAGAGVSLWDTLLREAPGVGGTQATGSFLAARAIAWFHVEHRSAVEPGPRVATLPPETAIHPTLGSCGGWLGRGPRVGSW
jgi:hypothetical protein